MSNDSASGGLAAILGDFRPGELPRALKLQAQFGLIVFALLLARTVRDALYLSRAGVEGLPYMYVGVSILTTAATLLYARVLRQRHPAKLAPWVQGLFALTFAGFALLVGQGHDVVYAALYLWVEVLTALTVVQFWNVANAQFHPRQAKRLYGFIAAGQAFGNLACGVVASGAGVWISVEALLWIVAAVAVIVGFLYTLHEGAASLTAREVTATQSQAGTASRRRRDGEASRRYIAALVVLVAGTYLATSWVDFQFKVIAKRSFDEAELTRFFGQFYGAVGVVAFVVQFALQRHVTRLLGLFGSLAVMPLMFTGLGLVLPFVPMLWVATGLKFSENGLRYAIYDPLLQTLYLPLPVRIRARVQSMAGGVVKPLAMGLSGALLIPLKPDQAGGMPVEWLGAPIAVVAAIVALLLLRLRAGYLRVLVQDTAKTVLEHRRRAPVELADPDAVQRLLELLRTGEAASIEWVLKRVFVPDPVYGYLLLVAALHRDDLSLQLRARVLLQYLPHLDDETEAAITAIQNRFLRALGEATAGDADWHAVARFLDEREPEVIEAALLYLFSSGNPQAVLEARDHLLILAAGKRTSDQISAVRLADFLLAQERRRVLEQAFAEHRDDVVPEALRYLLHQPDPHFIPHILGVLDRHEFRVLAVRALAAQGSAGFEALGGPHGPDSRREAPWRRLGPLWRTYAREARDLDWAEHSTTIVEFEADPIFWAPALLAAAQAGAPPRTDLDMLLETCVKATRNWHALYELLNGNHDDAAAVLLARAARDRANASVHAGMIALFLADPPRLERWDRLLVAELWDDAKVRQNLAEIIDESVGGPRKAAIIDLLERRFDTPEANVEVCFELIDPLPRLARRLWPDLAGPEEDDMMEETIRRVLFLSSVPLFQNLGGEDLEQIAEIMEEEQYPPDTVFIHQGEVGDSLYLIADGRVQVLVGGEAVASLESGAVVGELALVDDQPRSADVVAADEVRVLRLDRRDFEQLLDAYPQIGRGVMRVLTQRLRQANVK